MNHIGYNIEMEITHHVVRRLQRAINAMGADIGCRRMKVDGRLGAETVAGLFRFLAARGPRGEAALSRAIRALR